MKPHIDAFCASNARFLFRVATSVAVLALSNLLPGCGRSSGTRLAQAQTQQERFYALSRAAKESFAAGNVKEAQENAQELLALLPNFRTDWNYGNAIHDGNLVLGRIAVKDGRIEEAKKYLLLAGKTTGSPQLNSFGPNMSLAKDLLEKGEKDAVIEYFELCRGFWRMGGPQLKQWTDDVRAGRNPNFGANLQY